LANLDTSGLVQFRELFHGFGDAYDFLAERMEIIKIVKRLKTCILARNGNATRTIMRFSKDKL